MPSRQEILEAIYGAWRLAQLDPSGMQWFNLSTEGFFRSFFAAVLIAPLYFGIRLGFDLDPADEGNTLLRELAAYPVSWVAFPLLMVAVCRSLGLGRHYASYIIAYNWAQILITGLWLPLAIGLGTGLLDRELGTLLSLLVLLAMSFYLWVVTRVALQAAPLTAAGIVLLEYLTSLLIRGLFDRLI